VNKNCSIRKNIFLIEKIILLDNKIGFFKKRKNIPSLCKKLSEKEKVFGEEEGSKVCLREIKSKGGELIV
jgi:hypothetical protein